MPLFGGGPPDVAKLAAKGDVAGLVKSLRPDSGRSPYDRRLAAKSLGEIGGDAAIAALVGALAGDPLPSIRQGAALALAATKDPRAVPALIEAIADKDRDVRVDAENATRGFGRAAVPALLATAGAATPLRTNAVRLLGEIGDPQAVEPLCALLPLDNYSLGTPIAKALAEIADPRALKALCTALEQDPECAALEKDTGRVNAYAGALRRIGDKRAIPTLVLALRTERFYHGEVVAALRGFGAASVEPLIASLGDAPEAVREEAAGILGEIGDARAVEPLSALLPDDNYACGPAIADALGKLRDARAVVPLGKALADDPVHAARYAAALASIGDPTALPAIVGATERGQELSLLVAIGKLGDPGIAHLCGLLDAPEPETRRDAAVALGRSSAHQAIQRLVDALVSESGPHGDRAAQAAIVEALEQLGGSDAAQAISAWKTRREERIDRLKSDLLVIARREGYLSAKPGGSFNERCRNVRAIHIGGELERLGGLDLMRKVFASIESEVGPSATGLSFCWDGVGDWSA